MTAKAEETQKPVRRIFFLILKIFLSITISFFVGIISPQGWTVVPVPFSPYFINVWIQNIFSVVTFLVVFYLSTKGIYRVNQLQKLWNAVKGEITKSLQLELVVGIILSLAASFLVYLIAFSISFGSVSQSFAWAAFVFMLIILVLARRKIKYISELTNGIQEISRGNLHYQVPVKGNDELNILARNINLMSIELIEKIEDEKRSERTKNELISNMSHDLKTPLTTIIGFLTLLKDKKYEDTAMLDDYVLKAYSKSLKLKKLVGDLFEYTKLSNEAIVINKSLINIVELIEQQLGEMSVLAKENNLCFQKSFSDEVIQMNIDSDLMARALENILSNAIKYSYKDLTGKIDVSVTKYADRITIAVENEGDTIPTELLPLLFDRFYRVDMSRNSRIAGSGLGLAIAKSIIDLHNGSIFAESEANKIKIVINLYNQL